jgi:von Willebrand factor type A C-terminal domain/von Willebrand factor type A domain
VPEFSANVFQNEFLAEGATDANAVVSVACSGAGTAGRSGQGEAAEVIIVDTSGSMDMPPAKIAAARRAAKVAIGEIVDGTWFAVVSGHSMAQMVYPTHPGMAKMSDVTREEALEKVARLRSGGATAIGSWITAASALFDQVPSASQRHAILLTDGRIEGEPPQALPTALAAARGKFQCDCRGIGGDWEVAELRVIADALLGSVDIVADPADLEADFENMMRTAMSRGVGDVRLRVWAPQGSEVLFVRQVAPTVEDLTAKGVQISALVREFPTGAWSDETRDYHIAVRVPVAPVGNERLAARAEVVVNDQVLAKALVKATWSQDANLTTRIDPAVAHYTGQAKLADVIQRGLAAKAGGDERTATVLLGEAAKIAHEGGNEDTTRLLAKVVDVVDAEAGTVRLKKAVERTDEMALDTRSTKTTRIRKTT